MNPPLPASPEPDEPDEPFALTRSRAHLRNLFLRALGAVAAVAFLSLWSQLPLLAGERGLLPATPWLAAVAEQLAPGLERGLAVPTIFWWLGTSDAVLSAVALAGAACGVLLLLGWLPGPSLLLVWLLYLSLASVTRTFLSFQWDNLLLETTFFALFVTPWGLRLRDGRSPRRAAVFLMLWLVVRLHVESGAAKLLSGDPTWWDLTAMVQYYETAPLPTPLAWYAHQLPLVAHQATALATFVAELLVPLLAFAPRRLRPIACLGLVGLQVTIALTGNYGFFNLLSALLCLWLLDDGHLDAVARRFGRSLAPTRPPAPGPGRAIPGVVVAVVLVPLSLLPFLPWTTRLPVVGDTLADLELAARPVAGTLAPFRTLNAYHLFASMTLLRDEIVIQGSADGETWKTYEFAAKAGDPLRAPPVVAPHQPRVDFQLWFLLLPAETARESDATYFARRLGGPGRAWFSTLLRRLLEEPESVAELWTSDPFPDAPPRAVRLQAWRYRFTDRETRDRTGAWWTRELLHQSEPLGRP